MDNLVRITVEVTGLTDEEVFQLKAAITKLVEDIENATVSLTVMPAPPRLPTFPPPR